MSATHLAAALIVIFVVFVVALTGQLLYVHWRRRSFRRHTSHPPPIRSSGNQSPGFPTDDAATKDLVYFFCLKPQDLSPNKNKDGSSPNDQMVDVFKLLEANGPARFLYTVKEEDKDDLKSTSGVDFPTQPATKKDVCLPSCLQLAEQHVAEEGVDVTVDRGDGDMNMEFSTPCDSPSFFTPAGSPERDFMETKFVVAVDVTGNIN